MRPPFNQWLWSRRWRFAAGLIFLAALARGAEAGISAAASPVQPAATRGVTNGPVPAFPGAAGFAQFAIGGRGGRVLEVTNLDDSGPGTLRACLETPGPRTCVFRVAGTIRLKSELTINFPFVTIAGQTAPGGGITLKDRGILIRASHVVVRYLRVRPGPASLPNNNNCISVLYPDTGSFPGEAVTHDVIIDHCSASWGTDDNVMAWGNGEGGVSGVTFQWNIISEGLSCQSRVPGCGSRGLLIGNGANNISVHHNLFAHNYQRHPESLFGCDLDFVNNVVYDYGGGQSPSIVSGRLRPSHVNFVGNYYRQGPQGPPQRDADIRLIASTNKNTVFAANNIADRLGVNVADKRLLWQDSGGFTVVLSPHRFPAVPATDAARARTEVLQNAGAFLPVQDGVDRRIVLDVIKGGGGLVGYPEEVGGWVPMKPGAPPLDSDHDGIPDAWELEHHLDPHNPADGARDDRGDGYSNLEEFLNGIKRP